MKEAYDDGYLMLAYYIISHHLPVHVQSALTDDSWLRSRVREDCLNLDLAGPFIDTIVQHLGAEDRLWLRRRLRALGDDLFSKLDKERLRENISKIAKLP